MSGAALPQLRETPTRLENQGVDRDIAQECALGCRCWAFGIKAKAQHSKPNVQPQKRPTPTENRILD